MGRERSGIRPVKPKFSMNSDDWASLCKPLVSYSSISRIKTTTGTGLTILCRPRNLDSQ